MSRYPIVRHGGNQKLKMTNDKKNKRRIFGACSCFLFQIWPKILPLSECYLTFPALDLPTNCTAVFKCHSAYWGNTFENVQPDGIFSC